jgi:PAS domain S-box-containing protein
MVDSEAPVPGDVAPEVALLRVLVESFPAMLAYWGADQRCRFANRAYETWFGVSPEALVGKHAEELLGPLYALNLPHIQAVLRGEEQDFERDIPDPRGGPPRASHARYIPDVVDGKTRGFCVLVTDITRRKNAEEALLRTQRQLLISDRLAALATLASGIAHEINNPLAAVLANIEMSLESLARGSVDTPSLGASLVEAREGTRRIRDIVKSMKLLARGDSTAAEIVDVNDTLEQSIGLSWNAIRYRARLVRELGQPAYVSGNAAQLAQVFVSLLVNGAEALPEDRLERNEIRVSTVRGTSEVTIEIRDNGCGIPAATHARIFEPFFTTKEVGTGKGLGLSVARGIVTALGGTIAATSTVGEGTAFRLSLPLAQAPAVAPAPDAPRSASLAEPATSAIAGRARLLVIDDERAVTRVLERIFADDHDVVSVNHGRDALALLAGDDEPRFDLVLCDLMMPEISGEDVYRRVVVRRPELATRFIFVTGGAFTARSREFLDALEPPILDKPFDVAGARALVETHLRRVRNLP